MSPVQHNIIVLEDSMLTGMLGNAAIVRALPILRLLNQVPKKRQGCGRCGGGASMNARAIVMQQIKQAIAGLPPDRKVELKRLLNTRQLRIVYRRTDGRVISLTF